MIDLAPLTQTATTPLPGQQPAVQITVDQLGNDHVGERFKQLMLRRDIESIIAKNERLNVTTGVSVIDLQSQQTIVGHNLDTEQFAASLNKVPIAQLILRDVRAGTLQFDQVLTWEESDKRAGNGVYDQPGAPLQATVKDLLFDLLNPSGNTAVRILVNQGMGGAATVNSRFVNELHLQHTYLQPVDANRFYLGNSTARESLTALQQLLATQDTYGRFVKDALATNIYANYGVRSQLAGNDYIVLSNKVGFLDDSEGNNRHDVGIIYNTRTHKSYGYSFMTTAPGEAYETPTAQAGISLADMGAATLRFAGDKLHTNAKKHDLSAIKPEHKVRY